MLLDRDLVALAVIGRPNLKVDPSTLLYYPFLVLCVNNWQPHVTDSFTPATDVRCYENALAFMYLQRWEFWMSFCPNEVILWCRMTSWRHTMTPHYVLTSQHRPGFSILPFKPVWKSHFLTWWPWPSTWAWPSNLAKILSRYIHMPNFQ